MMASFEEREKHKSYEKNVLEIVYQMVEKQMQSSQRMLTDYCKNISGNISDICNAISVMSNTVDTLQYSQKCFIETQEQIHLRQNEMHENLLDRQKQIVDQQNQLNDQFEKLKKEFVVLKQEIADTTENPEKSDTSCLTDRLDNLEKQIAHRCEAANITLEKENSDEQHLSLSSSIKWGSISIIPETPNFPPNKKIEPNIIKDPKLDVDHKSSPLLQSTPITASNRQEASIVDNSSNHTSNLGNTSNDSAQQNASASHIKMRPVQYDGTDDWEEYISQFDIMSDINHWEDYDKGLYLASSLKGQARGILSELNQDERRDFSKLKLL